LQATVADSLSLGVTDPQCGLPARDVTGSRRVALVLALGARTADAARLRPRGGDRRGALGVIPAPPVASRGAAPTRCAVTGSSGHAWAVDRPLEEKRKGQPLSGLLDAIGLAKMF
jgi:hypothetical protein